MSFRARLTLFFVLIVIVPMVSVAVVVFTLIDDSETGKAEANVAAGRNAAIGLFRREVERAGEAAEQVGRDRALATAIRAGDTAAVERAAARLRRSLGLARLAIDIDGRRVVDLGSATAIGPATRDLVEPGGERVGRLTVSTMTAARFARLVVRITGLEAVLIHGDEMIGSTLPAARGADLPGTGEVELADERYRVASFDAAGFERGGLAVIVLDEADGDSVTTERILVAAILVGFLLIALAFAIVVSRSLEAHVGRLLAAARRLGSGDFSTKVPTEGSDEFAALGAEFNKMSDQLEARLEELHQERARLDDSIRRIGQTFASNLDRDRLLDIVVRTAVDAVGATGGRALEVDRERGEMRAYVTVGDVHVGEDAMRAAEEAARASGRLEEIAAAGHAALAFPLLAADRDGAVVGLISVSRPGAGFSDRERNLFEYLAGRAGVSLVNVDLHELVQRQAVTDELTGLFNHRRFQEVMAAEVERARRYGQPLGMLMLDIDDFKAVNDTHGHQQGDLVLQEVGRILRESSREIDEPARYGGEEMTIVLPQTDLDGAYRLGERIRSAVEDLEVPGLDGGPPVRVTVSIGAASLPENATDKDGLIRAADEALYAAKRAGKNRTARAAGQASPATAETARGG